MNKRIVITGTGILASTAIGKESFWEGLKEGMTGVSETKVRCHKCNNLVDSDAKYCDQCGEAMVKSSKCVNCGELNDPDAKFCDNCGKELSR